MPIAWKDLLDGTNPQNDYDLAVLSDKIWKIGGLGEIKAAVDQEVFDLFILMNVIGCWEGDGWGCMVGDQPEFIPYISPVLVSLGLSQMAEALRRTIDVFPDYIVYQDDQAYCDVINFVQNTRFKVSDPRLARYSPEQRAEMSRQFHEGINELEQISDTLWGNSKGWDIILRHFNKE